LISLKVNKEASDAPRHFAWLQSGVMPPHSKNAPVSPPADLASLRVLK
jgi:hypothetical protein